LWPLLFEMSFCCCWRQNGNLYFNLSLIFADTSESPHLPFTTTLKKVSFNKKNLSVRQKKKILPTKYSLNMKKKDVTERKRTRSKMKAFLWSLNIPLSIKLCLKGFLLFRKDQKVISQKKTKTFFQTTWMDLKIKFCSKDCFLCFVLVLH